MSSLAIEVTNLSKQYRIGEREPYRVLRDVLARALRTPFRGWLPFARPTEVSWAGSTLHSPLSTLHSPRATHFWALKDVSFSVEAGEVVGIIGRNGAGKSTLLKILSRITKPTSGHATVYGRVGSLLEVGTGFHPELTGRENVYLNGAILGMKKAEIERKFDEIVAFAEVEKFLDTPVKHYSSGMYVRLAFAVAAHLDPEILFVDEVLAVGDVAFQRKCLGKMQDVSGSGRTVIFVSHNMAAMRSLCTRGIVLRDGNVVYEAGIDSAASFYLNENSFGDASITWSAGNAPRCDQVRLTSAYLENEAGERAGMIDSRQHFSIALEYEILTSVRELRVGFMMQDNQGVTICGSTDCETWPHTARPPGAYVSRCEFPRHLLNTGTYRVLFGVEIPPYLTQLIRTPYCLSFEIEDVMGHGPKHQQLPGVITPALRWKIENLSNPQ